MQNAHIGAQILSLHGSMLDIASFMNRSQVDEIIIKRAGIPIDRALFPLLVIIERRGPIGIVDLADRAGRDYTTISRQVGKLESLGLVERRGQATDRRVREVSITRKGKEMTDAVDQARDALGRTVLAQWEDKDLEDLVRLMRRFADDLHRIL
jgi:DNA-binding MarR family transcriptional regulator